MKIQALASILAISLLAACNQKSEPDTAATAAPEPAVATEPTTTNASTPATVDTAFSVDPASMASCDPVIATVKWDIRQKHPAVSDVEILVGPDSAPTLFAAGGSFGEAKTGQWTAPGAIFRLRDKVAGLELERIAVTGPVCN